MVERAALGEVVKPVGAAADHHLALVRLAHIAVHGIGHHHHIHAGFDRLGDQSLQRHRFNWQTEACHIGDLARMPRHHNAEFFAADKALGGVHAGDIASFRGDAGDFALLDDVHPHRRAGPCIAPSHGIVTRGAAAGLIKRAQHRIARPVDIDDRHQFLDPLRPDPFGGDTLQGIGMGGALIAANFVMGLCQHQKPARAEHHVIVQILRHRLVKRARFFVDRGRAVLQVVRADDRGVASGVAAAKPALFDHRHIGDSVILAQVIGRRKPVATRADDDDIIRLFRQRRGPSPLPAHVMRHGFFGDGEN